MGRQGKAITLLVPSDVPKWRRMARNLGQAVALQRLAIDEEASMALPMTGPEMVVTQPYEQNDEQQVRRDRKQLSPSSQGRDRRAQPLYDSYAPSDMRRRRREHESSEIPASSWESEGFTLPERSSSGKTRDDRRRTGKQSRFDTAPRKHEVDSFAMAEPQQRTARKKPHVTPMAQGRRASVSKRAASR